MVLLLYDTIMIETRRLGAIEQLFLLTIMTQVDASKLPLTIVCPITRAGVKARLDDLGTLPPPPITPWAAIRSSARPF